MSTKKGSSFGNTFAPLTEAADAVSGVSRPEEFTMTEGSDTESCELQGRPSRRLRLVWDPSVQDGDSHDHRLGRVRRVVQQERRAVRDAEQSIRELAIRVGPTMTHNGIPREIRSHRWSLLNVPLMWAAAAGDRECPVLTWVVSVARNVSVVVQLEGSAAVYAGWDALHGAMRSWGVHSREQLTEWIFHQGFPRPRWGGCFSGRVQERIMNNAVGCDGRVAALEACYVQVTLSECDRHTNIASRQEGQDNPQDLTPEPEQRSVNGWESLDGVDLSAVYRTRFAVLQNCPFQFRGRFRLAARQALEARQEAVLNHDIEMEIRAWKLFCLFPFMLLRRPRTPGKSRESGVVPSIRPVWFRRLVGSLERRTTIRDT